MTLKTISLELARSPGQPQGDQGHGYVLRAPLDDNGYFNRPEWVKARNLCTVRRLADGRDAEVGLLILNKRGSWVFSYATGDEDDETLFRLDDHRFVPGEYISVTEHDGIQRTFRVASVAAWHPTPIPAPQ